MSDQEREALERDLATRIGDAAWAPPEQCSQGHLPHRGIADDGELCGMCVLSNNGPGLVEEAKRYLEDPQWHPEWRFHRVPKPLTRSLDALVPLVEAWCAEHGVGLDIARGYKPWPDLANTQGALWLGVVGEEWIAYADTPAEALALAWQAAMVAEEIVAGRE